MYIEQHVTPDAGEEALTGDTAEVRLVVPGVSHPWTSTVLPKKGKRKLNVRLFLQSRILGLRKFTKSTLSLGVRI